MARRMRKPPMYILTLLSVYKEVSDCCIHARAATRHRQKQQLSIGAKLRGECEE